MDDDAHTKTKCKACPANSFCPAGAETSTPHRKSCAPGERKAESGTSVKDTFCSFCSAGYYMDDASSHILSKCKMCDTGMFASAIKATKCDRWREGCSPGQFLKAEGTPTSDIECSTCEDGKYMDVAFPHRLRACKSCSSVGCGMGTKYVGCRIDGDGTGTCVQCEAGKYSSVQNPIQDQRDCTLCPAGKAAGKGSCECRTCNQGRHAPKTGMPDCMDCPTGYIRADATKCATIDLKKFRPDISDPITVTDCPAGSFCDGLNVVPCPPGTWSNNRQEMACISCDRGRFSSIFGSTECEEWYVSIPFFCFSCCVRFLTPHPPTTWCSPPPSSLLSVSTQPSRSLHHKSRLQYMHEMPSRHLQRHGRWGLRSRLHHVQLALDKHGGQGSRS